MLYAWWLWLLGLVYSGNSICNTNKVSELLFFSHGAILYLNMLLIPQEKNMFSLHQFGENYDKQWNCPCVNLSRSHFWDSCWYKLVSEIRNEIGWVCLRTCRGEAAILSVCSDSALPILVRGDLGCHPALVNSYSSTVLFTGNTFGLSFIFFWILWHQHVINVKIAQRKLRAEKTSFFSFPLPMGSWVGYLIGTVHSFLLPVSSGYCLLCFSSFSLVFRHVLEVCFAL